jgi:hypothetical protein
MAFMLLRKITILLVIPIMFYDVKKKKKKRLLLSDFFFFFLHTCLTFFSNETLFAAVKKIIQNIYVKIEIFLSERNLKIDKSLHRLKYLCLTFGSRE